MCVQRNIEVRSCNKWKRNKYYIFRFSFAAFGIQHAMRMRHIDICGPSGSTVFFHTSKNGTVFVKEKLLNVKRVFGFHLQLLSETCHSTKH
jgi:hypothetical protein